MEEGNYVFVREVGDFDLDAYTAHLGWNAAVINMFKIYSREGYLSFFLHDEVEGRMFEFVVNDPSKLTSKVEYDKVVQEYAAWRMLKFS